MVGVIASLAAYFALHTLFAGTRLVGLGPARVELPVWSSVDPGRGGDHRAGAGADLRRRWSPLRTLGVCAAVGLVVGVVGLLT